MEGLILKLKLQYFGHPMQRADSFEKILMLGKIIRKEEKGTTEDTKKKKKERKKIPAK